MCDVGQRGGWTEGVEGYNCGRGNLHLFGVSIKEGREREGVDRERDKERVLLTL
jgi:hypothetical protein